MWTRVALLLVALAAVSAEFGWKSGYQYTYKVTSKTLTGLGTAPQYSGLVVKANLVVVPNSGEELVAYIDHPERAQIHTRLEKGHEFQIPKEILQFQPFSLSKQTFIIRLKDGTVDELVISKEVPIWEVNIIKSIVSQLQVDTQGKRIIRSKMNMIPQNENEVTAVYKIMEDTVEGECEVLYDISPLPKYILQRQPHLAPLYKQVKEEEMINIVKTKNFTNCNQRPGYHYGITGMTQWEPTVNKMSEFLSRSSVGRVILSGNLKTFTIHSSETTNVVTLTPQLDSQDKGTVLSRVNLTLIEVNKGGKQVEQPTHPQTVKSLVYNYNHPMTDDKEARQKWDQGNDIARETGRLNRYQEKKNRFGRSITEQGNRKYSSDSSSSESSSISVENWHQDTPQLVSVPQNPFLPYFIGCNGHSIQQCKNVDVNQVVKKLCEQIGSQLEEPNHVPQINTLERFTTLVRVIRNMNAEQLHKITEELWVKEEPQTGNTPNTRRSYWMAFRDAVAQAGTGPALVTIKEWILNEKIHEEEAAQVVASLAESTMHPTPEYMNTFFELVKNEKVIRQQYLNTSAIYTFTKLVRMAQVDRRSIHNRYPVHSFGRFNPSVDSVVAEKYIPYFAEWLKKAVQEEDAPKVLVYIRALGNMAHPKILSVFEPYLEGKYPMTDFQRTTVIVCLNDLARVHPRIARSVLYKTFSNIGEVHQVRVAALYNLMKTAPPMNMLQRIAEASHDDPSIQVRSAIKSAIESAALLDQPINAELRRNAEAAVNMLTPEVFGVHYSRKNITDFVLKGLGIGYTDVLSYIGSEDSIIPSAVFYGLRSQFHGYQRKHFKLGAMVSSVQDLVNFFDSFFSLEDRVQRDSETQNTEWNYEKITKMLNIEHEFMKQIEGTILYKLAGSERYYTFDNHTIESVMEKLAQLPYKLAMGYSPVYQKLYNSYTVQIGFPTVTGLPFVYTLENPKLLYGRAKIQLKNDNIEKTQQTGTQNMIAMSKFGGRVLVQGVYTSRTQAELGFVTPFDHHRYVAGIQQQHQLNVPVQMAFDANLHQGQVKLEIQPFDKTGDLKIFQYDVKQYTAVADITDFKPIADGSNTKIIHVREPRKYEQIIGDRNGLGVRVHVETEKRHLDLKTLQNAVLRHNVISSFVFPTAIESMKNTKIDVYYDKNFAKSVVLNVGVYGTKYTPEGKKVQSMPEHSSHVQEIMKQVETGNTLSESVVVDFDWEVRGDRNTKYTATFGYGKAPVTQEKKFAVVYRKEGEKPYNLRLKAVSKMPFVPETDFVKAIQHQPHGEFKVDLKFGQGKEDGHITLFGKLERTPERVEYLKKLPQVQACHTEMKNGDKLLSACVNATYQANLLDKYLITVEYDNVPVFAKNITYKVYGLLRHIGYPYLSEKLIKQTQEKKIQLDVHFSPDLKTVTTKVNTPIGIAHFDNVKVNKYVRSVFVVHPTWDVDRRLGWASLRQQYDAYCTVDQTHVKTFDNMTYPIHMPGQWTPVFVSVPKIDQEGHLVGTHKVVVLTKETTQQKKDILIHTVGNNNEFSVVLTMKWESNGYSIKANGKEISKGEHEIFDQKGNTILGMYKQAENEYKFVFPECDFELLLDGTAARFQLIAGQIYKNQVLGLCGDYNGERNDFVTPKGKYLRDPKEFVASWVLTTEGEYGQLKERADKNAVRKTVILTGVVSDQDAGRTDKRGREYTKEAQLRGYYDSSSSSSSESKENESECMTKRIMVIERDGKHCFSTSQQLACKPGCQVEKTTEMTTKFVCVNKTQTSSHWAQMVTRGANPKIGDKVNNVQELTFQAPVECSKN